MSNPKTARGIRTLADLRCRCVIDEIDDSNACWNLVNASGKVPPSGRINNVHVHGVGKVSPGRAAWLLAYGEEVSDPSILIARTCESANCINPRHLRRVRRRQHSSMLARLGRSSSPAKAAAARETARGKAVVTPELLRWILESHQNAAELAHCVGVCRYHIARLRRRERARPASVFAWRP